MRINSKAWVDSFFFFKIFPISQVLTYSAVAWLICTSSFVGAICSVDEVEFILISSCHFFNTGFNGDLCSFSAFLCVSIYIASNLRWDLLIEFVILVAMSRACWLGCILLLVGALSPGQAKKYEASVSCADGLLSRNIVRYSQKWQNKNRTVWKPRKRLARFLCLISSIEYRCKKVRSISYTRQHLHFCLENSQKYTRWNKYKP